MAEESFGARFQAAVLAKGSLCAGIDPSKELLTQWGLADDAGGLASFGERCLEAFAGVVAVIKPQVAFWERHGSAGMAALETLIARARAADLLVIADAKRGDIDSTSQAYADAWLGEQSPFAPDAVTITPYVGVGALEPMFDAARRNARGVFVVTRSSNPEGRALQEAVTPGGERIEDQVLSSVAALNEAQPGDGLGPFGVVVGATLGPAKFPLSQLNGPVLAPGLGAQGARPADVHRRFSDCAPGSYVVSSSRALLAFGPDPDALAGEAKRLNEELGTISV
jgi:orotidine-5'-phosphate decarboxylase